MEHRKGMLSRAEAERRDAGPGRTGLGEPLAGNAARRRRGGGAAATNFSAS